MSKLIVCVMGENCEKFIGMCLEGVKNADAIVYCDGGSTDKTIDIVRNKFKDILGNNDKMGVLYYNIIENNYNQEDKTMNGKQRNFYLDYLKKHYPNDWALCLDADECVEDLNKIKEYIQLNSQGGMHSVKMRHFIGNLGYEDATQSTHYAMHRLFKISDVDKYPEVEHPVLMGPFRGYCNDTTIWHLAYLQGVFDIKKKYKNHLAKSNMHSPEYLDNWKDSHLLGRYPIKPVDVLEIPEIILKNFNINKDKYYFANRGIEIKNALMVKNWYDYFKPDNVLELGAGKGPYLYFWEWFVPNCNGIELSEYAVKHQFTRNRIMQGDISNAEVWDKIGGDWDLIMAIDVLEHLTDEQLNKTLYRMVNNGNRFLFSIPFIGDPNLLNDKTHIQHKTKEEWIKLISSYGIKIKEAPKDWLFHEQIVIGEHENI